MRQKGDQGSYQLIRGGQIEMQLPLKRLIKSKGKIQKIRLSGAKYSRKPARLAKFGFMAKAIFCSPGLYLVRIGLVM